MTIMASSSSILPTDLSGAGIEVSKDDLNAFVETGVIKKVENFKSHYAIQPCWLHEPGKGVMEEISRSVLGRWDKTLKSYIVHVENVRSGNDRSAALYEDHRWLHLNIIGTYFTYTPEAGQRLRGEIKKVGNKAAVCVVFQVFTATVFALNNKELKLWETGDEVQFEITSFVHRRKGPILRAMSTGLKNLTKRNTSFSNESLENGLDFEEEVNQLNEGNEIQESSSKHKKKKRKREHEHTEEEDILKVMKKIKVKVENENDKSVELPHEQNELTTEDTEEVSSSKKKKKKKKSSH